MMKKITLSLLLFLSFLQSFSQGVQFEMVNPKLIEENSSTFFEFGVNISSADEFRLHSGQLYFNYDAYVFGENIVNSGKTRFGLSKNEMLLVKDSENHLFKSLITNDNSITKFSFSWQNNFSCFSQNSKSLVNDTAKLLIKFRIRLLDEVNTEALDLSELVCFESGETFNDQTFSCPGNPESQITDDQFKCLDSKNITVLTPNTDNAICPGETLNISWESSGITLVNIYLFNFMDTTYRKIEDEVVAELGEFDWVIPNDLSGVNGSQIIVFEEGDTEVADTSGRFSVYKAYNQIESVEVCSGESYTFPDGTVEENITEPVTHTSELTAQNGCDSIIITIVTPKEVFNAEASAEVCSEESYTFPDGTVAENITESITHTSELTAQNGCDSIVVTKVNPILLDTSVTVQEPRLTSNAVNVTYQWINCEDSAIIESATDQTYTVTANGNYAVIISNGVCVDTSACYSILTIGIRNNTIGSVSIYPNPVAENFTINFEATQKKVRVDITTIIGQMIQSIEFENSYRIVLPLEARAGTYFVRIISGDNSVVFKLLKE